MTHQQTAHRALIVGAIALAIGLGWTTSSRAFPNIQFWHLASSGQARAGGNRAGGGGIYGTGGAQDFGILCSDCHIEPASGPGDIDFTYTVTPAFQNVGGVDAYVPGTRYTIRFNMTGTDLRRTGAMHSGNGMACAIEDSSGRRAGRFITDSGMDSQSCQPHAFNDMPANVPASATTFVTGDCHAVLPVGHADLTHWTFDWVAPAAGTGALNMFVGMVDGDQDGGSSLNDEVVERIIPLMEGS
ncbi:MAG: hypothetical protein AB7S26_37370 [Sandaracinaceae bacterium]